MPIIGYEQYFEPNRSFSNRNGLITSYYLICKSWCQWTGRRVAYWAAKRAIYLNELSSSIQVNFSRILFFCCDKKLYNFNKKNWEHVVFIKKKKKKQSVLKRVRLRECFWIEEKIFSLSPQWTYFNSFFFFFR